MTVGDVAPTHIDLEERVFEKKNMAAEVEEEVDTVTAEEELPAEAAGDPQVFSIDGKLILDA